MRNRPREPRPARFVKARFPDQAQEFFAEKFFQLFLSMGRHSTKHIDATSADAVVAREAVFKRGLRRFDGKAFRAKWRIWRRWGHACPRLSSEDYPFVISELDFARFPLALVDKGPTAPAGFFAGV